MKKAVIGGLLAIGCVANAHATSLNAVQTLQQFNLVVLHDAESSSHVDGRSWIGGNLDIRGGADYVQNSSATPASNYAGLTVLGDAGHLNAKSSGYVNVNGLGASVGGSLTYSNVNGGATVGGNAGNVNVNGGPAAVGGSAVNSNFNGGKYANQQAAIDAAKIQATSTDFAGVTKAASQQLKNLAGTGGITISGSKVIFDAVPVNGVAVFDLTGRTDVFSKGEFTFNRNNATTMIFNTDLQDVTIAANFLGNSAQDIATYSIWNFWNSNRLTISTQFGGSILAPLARFTNYNNIEGTVIADSLDQHGELHLRSYQGQIPNPPPAVPLPGAFVLMASALGLFTGIRFRKS